MNLTLSRPWLRIPLIVRAVVLGWIVASAGTLPWAGIFYLNTKFLPAVPWSIPIMMLYLWFFWKYVKGSGWPQSTSSERAELCRAKPLDDDVWGSAIGAGMLGILALLFFSSMLGRMIQMPVTHAGDYNSIPTLTLFFGVIMGSIVAGVVEESAFRGYMQGPIERRYGPVVAILTTGLVFGLAHFSHAEVTVALLPFYLFVAAIYGTMAYMTGSILPGLVLHATGDILGAFQFLATGRTEWQSSGKVTPLIWETGVDATFLMTTVGFLATLALAIWAFVGLKKSTSRSERQVGEN